MPGIGDMFKSQGTWACHIETCISSAIRGTLGVSIRRLQISKGDYCYVESTKYVVVMLITYCKPMGYI